MMEKEKLAVENKNSQLMKLAEMRIGFRKHLLVFSVCNAGVWVVWLLANTDGFPWPIWLTLGWGVAIVLNFLAAYVFMGTRSHVFNVDEEYEKLKRSQEAALKP